MVTQQITQDHKSGKKKEKKKRKRKQYPIATGKTLSPIIIDSMMIH